MNLSKSFQKITLFLVLITYCLGYSYSYADPPEGYILIEGDIQIPIHQIGIEMVFERNFWNDGTVPYEFDNNVTVANKTLMRNAMQEWENVANVHFVAKQWYDTSYLHIRDSTSDTNPENSSGVGPTIGPTTVNIFNWNWTFIMAHELAHSLGFWHEQSAPNRDTFITVNTNNIEPDEEYNFDLRDSADIYGYYDFDSVMHYDQCSFSNCDVCDNTTPQCWTITVKSPWNTQYQSVIGQRKHLSDLDKLTMSFIYAEDNWRFVDINSGGEFGTFFWPYKKFETGVADVPSGGDLIIQPGSYYAPNHPYTITKQMTIRAPLGGVVID